MDRTGIIVVTLCAILLGFWFVEQQKYAQQQARYAATNQVAKAQSQFAATNSNAVSPTLNATATAAAPVFDTNTPEELLVITNARARYTFTSRGGGLKSVELLDYPETVSPRWKKKVAKRRRGHAEPARAGAGAGDFGRCQPGRRRQFHPDPNRRWRSRGKIPRERPAAREGIPSQFELSRERERAAGKHFGPTARAARAGMGHWHGHADGAG